MDPKEHVKVDPDIYEFFQDAITKGKQHESQSA